MTATVATTPKTPLIRSQFQLPSGFLGRVAGWIMARQNAAMNRLAVKMLCVGKDDRVLEIGFGPGAAIKLLAEKTRARRIVGIDPSSVMLDQACQANRRWIDCGRVHLLQGSVRALPFPDAEFTRVFAVSTFHDWESRSAGLAEVRRVLAREGKLLLCLRIETKHPLPWSCPGVSPKDLEDDLSLIKAQGFRGVRLVKRQLGRRVACLVATR